MNTNLITVPRATSLIARMAGEHMHAKRVASLTNAVVGVVNAVSLSIHAIGAGLAGAAGLNTQHAIKQVDRRLSTSALRVWTLFADWVPYVLAARQEIVVVLDWTEVDADGHATIALYLITPHGRATPLVWKTVKKARLKGRRNLFEDEVIQRLHEVLPPGGTVTLLADRGFGFIIRFRGVVAVESLAGEVRSARAWAPNGRVRHLAGAKVTQDRYGLDAVVCVKARGMTEPWCLAVGEATITGTMAVTLYARRFTIEETFRDTNDPRYGLGLSATHVRDVSRRDRLLLICAMARTLLTLLGAAGESLGMDRMLKANTVKKRTHSLFRQGCESYAAIANMKLERLDPLVQRFGEYILREPVSVHAFGLK